MSNKEQSLCVDYSWHLSSCECVTDVLHILVRAYSQWLSVGSDVHLYFAPGENIAKLMVKGVSTEIVTLVIETMDLKAGVYYPSEAEGVQ